MKAIMKYPGSKWSIADWIISFYEDRICSQDRSSARRQVLFDRSRTEHGVALGFWIVDS